MTVTSRERELYERAWAVPAYADRSPGVQMLPIFQQLVPRAVMHSPSVLDAGTGSGKGALALADAGYTVRACDLTSAGLGLEFRTRQPVIPFHEVALWDDVARVTGFADYVYCTDVLEHIPLPFTMLVVHRLLKVARHGVFLSIALVPDHFGAWVGTPLHQSVQVFTDWRDQLATVGRLVEARDLLTSGVYLVAPC